VGVAGQILEHLSSAPEGRFGVDDPVFVLESGEDGLPGFGFEAPVDAKASGLGGAAEMSEEAGSEASTEDADRKEEASAGGDPARAIGRESTAGDDAVNVGVVVEALAPGVKERHEPDLRPEVLRIAGDLEQGLGDRPEEKPVEETPMAEGQRRKLPGQGEDDVEVADIQEIGAPGL
jgi:hypothetical protein